MIINSENIRKGLTFDDVLLLPKYSKILPEHATLDTFFSRNIKLKIPLVSAAMDTVTESQTAIAMAQQGGIGIIHKNLALESQAEQVRVVKKSETVMISDPVTIHSSATVESAAGLMEKHNISGLPVVDDKVLTGIVTGRDIRFEKDLKRPVYEVMTRDVLTIDQEKSLQQAVEIMHKHRIEKLPVLAQGSKRLFGMYTIKDIEKAHKHPLAAKDIAGRLMVGAAIGVVGDYLERAEALLSSGVDALVVDTAHGHSLGVISAVKKLQESFRSQHDFDIIAGNVATADGVKALAEAGVDGVKVGIGPGSICTTRIIAGLGVPQLTAVMDCVQEARKHNVPIIADGGVRFSGDIVKALAVGAANVMIGSLFAGTDESPGDLIIYQGKSYKNYRGMGSLSAMAKGSKDRYGQYLVEESSKFVPEGIEGRVPHRGSLEQTLHQLTGGIRSAMGYLGAATLVDLMEKAEFISISPAALRESHAHDIYITREAPNYKVD